MVPHPLPRRLPALATVSVLALSALSPAWSAPPPISPHGVPPARVGRVARLNGSVSFHTADADQWSPAMLNYPFTDGDAFWTEPNARADLQVGSNRFTLAPTTELDVSTLDDHALAASEPQGETYLELRTVRPGDTYVVQTPRGTVQIAVAGRYDVVAGDTDHPTLVTVEEGSAQVTGADLSLQIGPHQTATISGTDAFQGSVGPIAQDGFLTAMLAEDRPAPRASVPIPPIVQGMTGCESLETVGSWAEAPQYGTVWYPPVEAGWVPYRHGHWAYVAPWGWTWVDDAAWGFAPFHYGRWAQIDDRWGWIPVSPGAYADPVAAYPVPVYAPALVSFVDIGGAAIAGAAVGALVGGSVGWVPLGPREAYYPPYNANLNYIRSVNATTVQNVDRSIIGTTLNNNRSIVENFVNRGAATVVPAAAMLHSQPVAAAARPLPPDQFTRIQAQFRPPVSPVATTAGVTPAVARQFNFVAPPRPAQPIPGPAINPALLRDAPGRSLPAPGLRTAAAPSGAAAVPAAPVPGEPGRTVAPGAEQRPAVVPPEPRPATPGEPARAPEPALRPAIPGPAQARPAVPAAVPRPSVSHVAPTPRPAAAPPRAQSPRPAPVARPAAPPVAFRPASRPVAPPARAAAPPPRALPQAAPRPAAPPPRAAPPHPAPREPEHH